MDEDLPDDAISAALQSRRIPHGHSRSKKGRGSSGGYGSSFDPLRARGRYEVTLGSGKNKKTAQNAGLDGPSDSWLEIHELTADRDGLVGTFSFRGKEEGMCLLAGSRKGLAKIVGELDHADEVGDEQDGLEAEPDDDDAYYGDGQSSESEKSDLRGALEIEDDQAVRTARSFEKNTFRRPKFWMTWRRAEAIDPEPVQDGSGSDVKRTAYLVFSGADCQQFEGTISSSLQEWDNLKIRGRKAHSRVSPCPLRWSDLPS